MIKGGLWNIQDEAALSKIADAAFALLLKRGAEVQHKGVLRQLADAGCRVKETSSHVLFSEKLIRKVIDAFGSKSNTTVSIPQGWIPATRTQTTGSFPHFLDWPSCRRRLATAEDVINNARMAHILPEFETVGKAMTCYEIDQRIEPIWNVVTLMDITDKPIGGGEVMYPENIKHLVHLGEIYSGKSKDTRFVADCDFCIPPLRYGRRTVECMIEKSGFGVKHVPGTMPVSGISGPVTVAGTAALALAELICGWVIYYLLNPDTTAGGIVCTGSMDMRTMRPSFGSPEAILQDVTVVQAAKQLYGIEILAAHNYVDCKTPGIQAVFEKMLTLFTFPFNGYLAFSADGLLSAGQDYSPVEQLLEMDMKGAIDRLLGTFEVSAQTLALDVFDHIKVGSSETFLDMEHTLQNFKREQWYPRWFDRNIWQDDDIECNRELKMLHDIDAYWRNGVQRYKTPEIDQKRLKEAHRVLKAAEDEMSLLQENV